MSNVLPDIRCIKPFAFQLSANSGSFAHQAQHHNMTVCVQPRIFAEIVESVAESETVAAYPLSVYVGPMPLPVVPILAPLWPVRWPRQASGGWEYEVDFSMASALCDRWFLSFSSASASSRNSTGSSTTPLPMILVWPMLEHTGGCRPEHIFLAFGNSKVCRRWSPPWNPGYYVVVGSRARQLPLPLPSSPTGGRAIRQLSF